MAIWIAENIFWRMLRTFFHTTETATSRNELYFYHKSDFQKLVTLKFEQMQKDQKIKKISLDSINKLNESFEFCPVLARCRLFNKSSLESTRLIIRKPKIDDAKTKVLTELRLLLEYAAKKFFVGSVDVRGNAIIFFYSRMYSLLDNRFDFYQFLT